MSALVLPYTLSMEAMQIVTIQSVVLAFRECVWTTRHLGMSFPPKIAHEVIYVRKKEWEQT